MQTDGCEEQEVVRGPSFWHATYSTPILYGSDFTTMSAWLELIKNPPQYFWAWDTKSRYPFAYRGVGFTGLVRAGGGAFDGTCTLASVASDSVSVGLSGLPVGFMLGPEDRISFSWDTSRQALHKIVSPASAADGSGNLTVEVRGITNPIYAPGATAALSQACFKAYLRKGTDKAPRDDQGYGKFSFEALQTLRQ